MKRELDDEKKPYAQVVPNSQESEIFETFTKRILQYTLNLKEKENNILYEAIYAGADVKEISDKATDLSIKNNVKMLVKELEEDLGKVLMMRPYIAIVTGDCQILYIDDHYLKLYTNFIKKFVDDNFFRLNIGDYSFPISNINLVFFKITKKLVLVLFTVKGKPGQLLSFKSRLNCYAQKFNKITKQIQLKRRASNAEASSASFDQISSEVFQSEISGHQRKKAIPILTKTIKPKEKISIQEAAILQLITEGKYDIYEICKQTNLTIKQVDEILEKYRKKGKIQINVEGSRGLRIPINIAKPGEVGIVTDIHLNDSVHQRLFELGLLVNEKVRIIKNHYPGPILVEVRGTRVALGREYAKKIFFSPLKN